MKFFDNTVGNIICNAGIGSIVGGLVVGVQGAVNGAVGARILSIVSDIAFDPLGCALVGGLGNMAFAGFLGLIIGGAVGSLESRGFAQAPDPVLLKTAIFAEVVAGQISGTGIGHYLYSEITSSNTDLHTEISAVAVGTLVTGTIGLLTYLAIYCGYDKAIRLCGQLSEQLNHRPVKLDTINGNTAAIAP